MKLALRQDAAMRTPLREAEPEMLSQSMCSPKRSSMDAGSSILSGALTGPRLVVQADHYPEEAE